MLGDCEQATKLLSSVEISMVWDRNFCAFTASLLPPKYCPEKYFAFILTPQYINTSRGRLLVVMTANTITMASLLNCGAQQKIMLCCLFSNCFSSLFQIVSSHRKLNSGVHHFMQGEVTPWLLQV